MLITASYQIFSLGAGGADITGHARTGASGRSLLAGAAPLPTLADAVQYAQVIDECCCVAGHGCGRCQDCTGGCTNGQGGSCYTSSGPTPEEIQAQRDRDRANALNAEGLALKRAGRYEEAMARYVEANHLDPENWHVRHNMAVAINDQGLEREREGNLQSAINSFEKALEWLPDGDDETMRTIRDNSNKTKKRLREQQAAEQLRNEMVAIFNQGQAYFQAEDWDSAIAYYLQYLAYDPQNRNARKSLAAAYYNRALRDLKNERTDAAIAGFLKYLDYDSRDADTRKQLGRCYQIKALELAVNERWDEAVASLEAGLKYDPNTPDARQNLAKILDSQGSACAQAGNDDKALACFRRAVEVDPSLRVVRNHLAEHLVRAAGQRADQANWDAAVPLYREAAALFPKDTALLRKLLKARMEQEDQHRRREVLAASNRDARARLQQDLGTTFQPAAPAIPPPGADFLRDAVAPFGQDAVPPDQAGLTAQPPGEQTVYPTVSAQLGSAVLQGQLSGSLFSEAAIGAAAKPFDSPGMPAPSIVYPDVPSGKPGRTVSAESEPRRSPERTRLEQEMAELERQPTPKNKARRDEIQYRLDYLEKFEKRMVEMGLPPGGTITEAQPRPEVPSPTRQPPAKRPPAKEKPKPTEKEHGAVPPATPDKTGEPEEDDTAALFTEKEAGQIIEETAAGRSKPRGGRTP